MSEHEGQAGEEQKALPEEPAVAKRRASPSAKEAKVTTKEEVIEAIKRMTVLELAELVKTLEAEFGVSAATPMAVAPAPAAAVAEPAAPPAEEKTEFNVILKDFGSNKISVIKAVREVTALGLKEAKDLVEAAPKAVKEGVSKSEASSVKEKLEAAGAAVEIQ